MNRSLQLLRGTCRLVSGGGVFMLGISSIYGMESMTTRVAMGIWEAFLGYAIFPGVVCLWLGAGLSDVFPRHQWSYWISSAGVAAFIGYFTFFTSDYLAVRIVGPVCVMAVAALLFMSVLARKVFIVADVIGVAMGIWLAWTLLQTLFQGERWFSMWVPIDMTLAAAALIIAPLTPLLGRMHSAAR